MENINILGSIDERTRFLQVLDFVSANLVLEGIVDDSYAIQLTKSFIECINNNCN